MGQPQSLKKDFDIGDPDEPYCLVHNDLVACSAPLRANLVENDFPEKETDDDDDDDLLDDDDDHPVPTYRLRDGLDVLAEHFQLVPSTLFFQHPKMRQSEMKQSEISPEDLKPGFLYCVRGELAHPETVRPSTSPLYRVGILHDDRMLAHTDPQSMISEKPFRSTSILHALDVTPSLRDSVIRISETREATTEELMLCHDAEYLDWMAEGEERSFGDIYYASEKKGATAIAARVAVGTVLVGLSHLFATPEDDIEPLDSCFCVVRPPGHHALRNRPMGFCFFSNIAIGAKWIRQKYPASRVLIVDWDVHHGNGTQELRMDDSDILLISLQSDIYPGTGQADNVGENGNTVNVLFREEYGDNEIVQAFHSVVLPIAYEFAPDAILISAGFDAAAGDPLGRCFVSPFTFGYLTNLLMPLTGGKRILLALEGGYNEVQLMSCFASCVHALLGHRLRPLSGISGVRKEENEGKGREISKSALEDIAKCQRIQSENWECMALYADLQKSKPENDDEAEFSSGILAQMRENLEDLQEGMQDVQQAQEEELNLQRSVPSFPTRPPPEIPSPSPSQRGPLPEIPTASEMQKESEE